jgi:hypothetical protein
VLDVASLEGDFADWLHPTAPTIKAKMTKKAVNSLKDFLDIKNFPLFLEFPEAPQFPWICFHYISIFVNV